LKRFVVPEKNGKTYSGYKNTISIDLKNKLVQSYAVTAASVHDSNFFETFLDDTNSSRDVYADFAYRSAESAKRWDKIPTSTQAKLLGNVWCGACSKVVYILVESGKIKNNDLILTGRCADCGGSVGRLVEGD
jgi:hypothetical protein